MFTRQYKHIEVMFLKLYNLQQLKLVVLIDLRTQ